RPTTTAMRLQRALGLIRPEHLLAAHVIQLSDCFGVSSDTRLWGHLPTGGFHIAPNPDQDQLPNKPRGVPRVDDRRVLNGIFWAPRSGAPWPDLRALLRLVECVVPRLLA